MAYIKDWKPGEYKASVKLTTDNGTTLDFYIPHLSITQGVDLLHFITELFIEKERSLKDESRNK